MGPSSGISALAALGLLALPSVSLAQSSADTAAAWGLVGIWQVECGGTLGNGNPIYSYRTNGAQVILDRQFGSDLNDTNTISGVRRLPTGAITYSVVFQTTDPPQTREHIMVKSQDGRMMRAVSNRDVDTGTYSVQDGKFTSNGATTPWMNRCN